MREGIGVFLHFVVSAVLSAVYLAMTPGFRLSLCRPGGPCAAYGAGSAGGPSVTGPVVSSCQT